MNVNVVHHGETPGFPHLLLDGEGQLVVSDGPSECCCPECVCENCEGGVPGKWQIVLSGFTNGSCGECTNLNGTWVLECVEAASSCFWRVALDPTICGGNQITMDIFDVGFPGPWLYRVVTPAATFQFQNNNKNCKAVSNQSAAVLSSVGNCGDTGATCHITAL